MQTLNNTTRSNFESSFSLFRWKAWACAAIATLLLNSFLFLLLPILIHPSAESTDSLQRTDHIRIIRLKSEEIPARKKVKKLPKPPEEKPQPQKKIALQPQIAAPKLTLPFKLNTRLPKLSTDFQLPLFQTSNLSHSISGSVGMHQLDAPLTPLSRIPPIYPMRARRKGLEGWVRIAFEVDEQGQVGHLQILAAEPSGVFDNSVINCVTRWRYKPGTVEGIAVRAKMETIIRFKME
ncbi:MAG: energy transducer TonB [Desulfotalea sp.]|nr:MAG: energy transducer TonB [Desulfotalea sp.]